MREPSRHASSIQPRKQRLSLANAPQHARRKSLSAHLAEELIVQYKRRAFPLRKGDTVKVLRGDDKGKTGEVLTVDTREYKITIDGVTVRKANGTEVARPVHPSNVLITRLVLSDPKRRAALERKGITVKAPAGEKPQPAARKKTGKAQEETP